MPDASDRVGCGSESTGVTGEATFPKATDALQFRAMTDEQPPLTANELRTVCDGWPQAVVPRAVATVVPEPDATLIAAWLTDLDATHDAPPLTADAIHAIARQLRAQRH